VSTSAVDYILSSSHAHRNDLDGKGVDPDLRISLTFEVLQVSLICNWLTVCDLRLLDIAWSNHRFRRLWLNMLKSHPFQAVNDWHHSHLSMRWVINRKIRITQVLVNPAQLDTISDWTLQSADIDGIRGVPGTDITSSRTLFIWEESEHLQILHLAGCQGITDIDLIALGHGCGQIKLVDLTGCTGITDVGVSALGHGCGQL
jgi:hypothetical protein